MKKAKTQRTKNARERVIAKRTSRVPKKKSGIQKKSVKRKLLAGGNPQIAKADGDAPVQAYIDALSGWKRDAVRRVDALVTKSIPRVRKAVKWNSPMYGMMPHMDVPMPREAGCREWPGQGWFLGIHTFRKYIKVAFFNGASLTPIPPGDSTSKNTRYVHIEEDGAFDEAQFKAWVKQASKLQGWGKN